MRRSRKRFNRFWEEMGNAWTLYQTLFLIIGIILFFLGLFGWGYVLAERNGSCSRLLKAEIIVQILMLVGSIARIGFFDYEDKIGFHIKATLAVDTLFSVAAFLIAGIHILPMENTGSVASFYYIMDFFVQLVMALILAFLPALILAVLMWVVVRIFGQKK